MRTFTKEEYRQVLRKAHVWTSIVADELQHSQRITNGKIAENWVNLDVLGMLQQPGVIPPMG